MRCSLESPSRRVARSPPLGALSGSACSPHADRERRGQWHGWAVLPRCRVRSCAGGGECVCGVAPITEPCGRPRAHFRRRRPRHEHRRECVAVATASVIASAAVHRCHRARRAATPRAREPRAIVTTSRRTPAAPGQSNASTQRGKKTCSAGARRGVRRRPRRREEVCAMGARSGRRGCAGRGARRVWHPSPRRGQPFFFFPADPSNASLSPGHFYFCLLPSINCIPVFRSTPCLNIRSLAS